MKFWSMDIPGRDPVVLLWAWWVSLALSCSLNFASFPVRIPVQSSVLICQRHHYEFSFLSAMAVDCGDEIPSKSKPQPAGVTSYANPANLLSFRCFVSDFLFWSSNCNFSLVFHKFRESSTNSSVCKRFPYPNFFLNFCPNRHVPYIFHESRKDSSHSLVSSCVFQCSIVLLVFARPEDLCGSFFFFLNGNSFPSASTLSCTCSSAYPPRYCLPEMSFPMELLAVW